MKDATQDPAAREFSSPKAIEMSEMALIHNDLNTCIRSIRVMQQRYMHPQTSDEDRDIKLALFRDAINLYVSAFVGSGIKLDQSIVYADIEGSQEFFQWARDVRDTYAAHTFGPARQCVACIAVDPHSGKSLGVGAMRMDLDIANEEAVHQLGVAATIAAKFAERSGRQLNDELIQDAAKLSAEQIAALPPARTHVPEWSELRMGRQRFRAIKAGIATVPKRSRKRRGRATSGGPLGP